MISKRSALAALGLSLSSFALGQAAPRPDPANPGNANGPIRYESVFAGYRAFTDEKVVSWRATNDLVHKLGGWSAFLRDKVPDIPPVTAPAEAPEQKSSAPSTQPTKKPGRAGHQ